MKIYKIVSAFTLEALTALVNEVTEEGYEPLGGPFPVSDKLGWYGQALIAKPRGKK